MSDTPMKESFTTDMPSHDDDDPIWDEIHITTRVSIDLDIYPVSSGRKPIVILTADTYADDVHVERVKKVIDDESELAQISKSLDLLAIISSGYEGV